jgi:hypothetical protein
MGAPEDSSLIENNSQATEQEHPDADPCSESPASGPSACHSALLARVMHKTMRDGEYVTVNYPPRPRRR